MDNERRIFREKFLELYKDQICKIMSVMKYDNADHYLKIKEDVVSSLISSINSNKSLRINRKVVYDITDTMLYKLAVIAHDAKSMEELFERMKKATISIAFPSKLRNLLIQYRSLPIKFLFAIPDDYFLLKKQKKRIKNLFKEKEKEKELMVSNKGEIKKDEINELKLRIEKVEKFTYTIIESLSQRINDLACILRDHVHIDNGKAIRIKEIDKEIEKLLF